MLASLSDRDPGVYPLDVHATRVRTHLARAFRRPLPLRLVVPRASANPYIEATPFVTWTTTHLTLVKPRNRQRDVYAGVLRTRFSSSAWGDRPAPR